MKLFGANKLIPLLIIGWIYCGCVSKDHVPSEFIQPNDMEHLLTDLQLARATAVSLRLPTDSLGQRWIVYKEAVFAKYAVDSVHFRKSFEYYASHPFVFDKIAEKMVLHFDALEYQGLPKTDPQVK